MLDMVSTTTRVGSDKPRSVHSGVLYTSAGLPPLSRRDETRTWLWAISGALVGLFVAAFIAVVGTGIMLYPQYKACNNLTSVTNTGSTVFYSAQYHPLSSTCTLYGVNGNVDTMHWADGVWMTTKEGV